MKKIIILIILIAGTILAYRSFNSKENNQVDFGGRVMGPQEVVLAYGETKSFSDLNITFNNLVADYRCPQDAECIEGGAVVANITLSVNEKEVTLNKPSDEVPLEFEGYKISIISTNPPLISGNEINPEDYVITFIIETTIQGENI